MIKKSTLHNIIRKILRLSKYLRFLELSNYEEIIGENLTVPELINILNNKFKQSPTFYFNDKKLDYFYHSYNNNRLTERSIEIPIVGNYLKESSAEDVLEIGNVSNHYYSYFKDLFDSKIVIDRYESGWGVINKDIGEFESNKKFEFIFSISTFEHMDSDLGRNPNYIPGNEIYGTYAADNIYHVCHNLLKQGGTFIITALLGYTEEWDKTVLSPKILKKEILDVKKIKTYFLKRINNIEWKQIEFDEVSKIFKNKHQNLQICSFIEIIK